MKPIWLALPLATTLALFAAGCGSSSPVPSPSTTTPPEEVETSQSDTSRFELDGVSFEIPEGMSFSLLNSGNGSTSFIGSNSLGEIYVRVYDEERGVSHSPHAELLTIDGYTVSREQAGDNGVVEMYRFDKGGRAYEILVHCQNFELLDQLAPHVLETLHIS